MRLNIKKISAIAASALMVGMTMGVAAAANYPNPFVVSGSANVAIVYGTGAGVSSLDLVQAGNIESNLQSYMGAGSTTSSTGASVNGEAAALFTSGTNLFLGTPLNSVYGTFTKAQLPNTLADAQFSGNVAATLTQSIQIGSSPRLVYAQLPSTSNDPTYGIQLNASNYVAGAVMNFTEISNKPIAFSDTSSKTQQIVLFGKSFTISSYTDNTSLVLLQNSQKVNLVKDVSSASATGGTPSQDVTVNGVTYTVALISGTSSATTIQVTDKANGNTDSHTINTGAAFTFFSGKSDAIGVAVQTATQAGNIVTSTVSLGTNKITLQNGQPVMTGDNLNVIPNTYVTFGAGTNPGNLTSLSITMAAPDTNHLGIMPGVPYVDPIFGAIQLNFAGLNIPENSSARETIAITSAGSNKLQLAFKDYNNNPISTIFAVNSSSGNWFGLNYDDYGDNISTVEGDILHVGSMVIVGNENTGALVKVTAIQNSTSSTSVSFQDMASTNTYQGVFSAGAASGTVQIGPSQYSLYLQAGSAGTTNTAGMNLTMNYPGSSSNNVVVYPTIQTSAGGKLGFWKPNTVIANLSNFGQNYNMTASSNNITGLMFPIGNGQYTTISITPSNADPNNSSFWQLTGGGVSATNISTNATTATSIANGVRITAGEMQYDINGSYNSAGAAPDSINITPVKTGTTADITGPAVYLIEGKDYNNAYNALEITTENAGAKVGISSSTTGVADTWANSSAISLYSNNKLTKKADYFGAVTTIDTTDSDQYVATISNPTQQVLAQVYLGANGAIITPGSVGGVSSTGSTQLGDVLVKDTDVSGVSQKNLIVVGGSCINSVAASLLGAPACGADFTTATGVGTGQFLIKSFNSPYDTATTNMVALLVAGYDASDTVNAATYLRTQAVDTTVGKKYIGTSGTTATLTTSS
jgi:hypothetical protein